MSGLGPIGRLSQVIDRWIYTAGLCYGLGIDEQQQMAFAYEYSIYQVDYSRNLVFASGAVMDRLFNTMVDRTPSRLNMRGCARCSTAKAAGTFKPGQGAIGTTRGDARGTSVEPDDLQGPPTGAACIATREATLDLNC